MRVDVPSGGWVEFRDPKVVTERLRRPVKQAAAGFREGMPDEQAIVAFDETLDLACVALIESWSFGAVTVDGLLDLQGPDVDAIHKHVEPLLPALMPNFGDLSDMDPKAPPAD